LALILKKRQKARRHAILEQKPRLGKSAAAAAIRKIKKIKIDKWEYLL
jgi:hypothetical protein